jgi:hypothetical protein
MTIPATVVPASDTALLSEISPDTDIFNEDATTLSDDMWDYVDEHEPNDTNEPEAIPRAEGPSIAQQWTDLAALQRQYIIGSGAEDMLCLSLAVAYRAQYAQELDPSVWLFLIGDPSSGKSATVLLLKKHPNLIYRDELTSKALSSGSRDSKGNAAASLLDKLDKKCLVMPDMASFFEQHEETVRSIFGTMTSAFEGTYDKSTGTVGDLSHKAHFGWLGVTTPRAHQNYEGFLRKLGPRVLAYRVPSLSTEEERRVKKLLHSGGRRDLSGRLAQAAVAHLHALGQCSVPSIPEEIEETLDSLDDVLRQGRALIEGEYIQKEGPGRAYQQLRNLMRAVAMVRGHSEVTWADLDLIRQVALGSMPQDRARAIEYLAENPTNATCAGLAARLGRSPDTARRTFNDLLRLKLVTKQPPDTGLPDTYLADPIIGMAFKRG